MEKQAPISSTLFNSVLMKMLPRVKKMSLNETSLMGDYVVTYLYKILEFCGSLVILS